jgi:flagellar hook assembly protein FlgD
VRAEIFDLAGRRVARLAEQAVYSAGIHRLAWDGRTSEGSPAASGVYVIQLAGGPKTATRKFVLLAP